jgi:hypothetical protein
MAVAVTDTVFDLVILATALQVLDKRALERGKVLRMQPRGQMAEHGRDVFGLQAEQFLELGVMDFVGLQVPVPEPQLAGFQGQGQARLAFTQGLVGDIQLQAALRHALLQPHLGRTQPGLGRTTLLDLPGQGLVKLRATGLRLLQMLDQGLVLEPSQHAVVYQPVDLPGHYTQENQQDQPKPAPTELLLIAAPEKITDCRQQARQGEGQVCRKADGVGNAGRQRSRADQAKRPGLLLEAVRRYQRNAGPGQRQAGHGRAQQKHAQPDRVRLAAWHRRIERCHLDHPQRYQRQQPDQPYADQEIARWLPQQCGTDQTVDQHEQRGQQ